MERAQNITKYEIENTNILPRGVNESNCIITESRNKSSKSRKKKFEVEEKKILKSRKGRKNIEVEIKDSRLTISW